MPPARDARSRLCGIRVHAEAEGKPIGLKELQSKIYISLQNWGQALTPFFGTCQSVGQTADREWVGTGSGGEERESILGLWAGGGIAADGAMEGAIGATSASYLLDFVSFV